MTHHAREPIFYTGGLLHYHVEIASQDRKELFFSEFLNMFFVIESELPWSFNKPPYKTRTAETDPIPQTMNTTILPKLNGPIFGICSYGVLGEAVSVEKSWEIVIVFGKDLGIYDRWLGHLSGGANRSDRVKVQ